MKFSVCNFCFVKNAKQFETGVTDTLVCEIDMEDILEKIVSLGCEGVEFLTFVPNDEVSADGTLQLWGKEIEVDKLKEMLESYNLEVPSIIVSMSYLKGTGSPWVFTSPDSRVRKRAVKGFKEFIRLAHDLDTKSVCVASIRGRIGLDVPRDKAVNWAVESVKECDEFAQKLGIVLTVEPLNRFEIDFINTNEECKEFIDTIGSDNIYILADVYHMNIEEVSIASSIRKFGEHLYHFHVCDSNRLAPGRGHADFQELLRALRDIGYQRYLSMEVYPVRDLSVEEHLRNGINYLKRTMKSIAIR